LYISNKFITHCKEFLVLFNISICCYLYGKECINTHN